MITQQASHLEDPPVNHGPPLDDPSHHDDGGFGFDIAEPPTVSSSDDAHAPTLDSSHGATSEGPITLEATTRRVSSHPDQEDRQVRDLRPCVPLGDHQ